MSHPRSKPTKQESRPALQEDMHYDLEYAHVLGDELDTAELRSINSLWRAPAEAARDAAVPARAPGGSFRCGHAVSSVPRRIPIGLMSHMSIPKANPEHI